MRRVSARALGVVLTVAVVTVATLGATAVTGQHSASSAPDRGSSSAADRGGTPAIAPMADRGGTPAAAGRATQSPAARLACTNGTSEAVVACGYTPGPTAVELGDQWTLGQNVTVAAAELHTDGFVAVHRVSFVDGAYTDSIVGVSDPLQAGLHRDVTVPLRGSRRDRASGQLIAVAYRDSDDDGTFDFAETGGDDDRPFTNTYSADAGNVTDEAGDVIGDVATVSLLRFVEAETTGPPASVDDDPLFEDLNGDGRTNAADVVVYNRYRDRAVVEENPRRFDYDGDGVAGTKSDSEALADEVQ